MISSCKSWLETSQPPSGALASLAQVVTVAVAFWR